MREEQLGFDAITDEEYVSQSKLLREFLRIPDIDKAWTFKHENGNGTGAMFSIGQPNYLADKKRKFILSANIWKQREDSIEFQWGPFPLELTGVSIVVPSPSGSKLLLVRNPEHESPTKLEIWSRSQLEKEFHIPNSIHGSVFTDAWFEGISWNSDGSLIAYVAEAVPSSRPTFNEEGYKKPNSTVKDNGSWKGQGEWEEFWGETYAGKRQPTLFVINIASGEVLPVKGIPSSLSVGQVVWAPSIQGSCQYLVFVGWASGSRKLGMKYCYNRPSALYAVPAPLFGSETHELEPKDGSVEDLCAFNITQSITSAFFPRFSPDGKFLVFLSEKCSVESGIHSATGSLHRLDWPDDIKLCLSAKITDVIPVVHCADDGCFPGLYSSGLLASPWISDGLTMILTSVWGSRQVILSVNVWSGEISQISPISSHFSWSILALDGDNIIAVCSSPVDIPQIMYGRAGSCKHNAWSWLNVSSSIFRCSEKVKFALSSHQFSILKIPVKDDSSNQTRGASHPYEAVLITSNSKEDDLSGPLIVVLHGGPHSVSLTSFSKTLAFLSSLGYNMLIVNYRGSLGFGEEALQSLPGKVGSQDVNDVLTAIDHLGLASCSKIAVLGGSHGGFLAAHLIGQAPSKFAAAALRNPVCNLSSMVATSDIPDWCFMEAYGLEGKSKFTEAPSPLDLAFFYSISPISHFSKVKTPTIFLVGAQDLRVPPSNALQYARALKENGVEVKIMMFPNDGHAIDRPQSEFECFLNIGVWFNKYCK